jgi:hypothetical protein
MASKRKVVGLLDGGWWVWLLGSPAIKVSTEGEARQLFEASFRDNPGADHSQSIGCQGFKIVWSDRLPLGEDHHKVVFSPVCMVAHRGMARLTLEPYSPTRFERVYGSWLRDKHCMTFGHPLSPPEIIKSALDNPDILKLRRLGRQRKTMLDQLDEYWPLS